MSDYQAIGAVSETLRAVLEDRMEVPSNTDVSLTIGTPRSDVQQAPEAAEPGRVNVFLYRVSENGTLKNQEIPGHGNAGAYGSPPLSLELYYLVTAYGTWEHQGRHHDTLAQYLLGSAMRVFHDYPIITEELRSLRPPVGTPLLHVALRDDYERVKLSLDPINLEDLTKLWTALTLPFRAAAAYQVSVVQIESRRSRRFPQRVMEPPRAGPRVYVTPALMPRLDEVTVRWVGDAVERERRTPYARVGDTLILKGVNLASDATRVRFGRLEIPLGRTEETRIEVRVPDAMLPDGTPIASDRRLQPGAQTVDVVTGVLELLAAGFPSNQAVFMLVPQITLLTPPSRQAAQRTIQINGTRLYEPRFTGEVVVGRAVIPTTSYLAATDAQITLALPDTLVAWPVSARVSGSLVIFPGLSNDGHLMLTIGGDGPHDVSLARSPRDLQDAAELLQEVIRAVANDKPTFADARVTTTSDQRLMIVPGGLMQAVDVAVAGADTTADSLKLTAGTGAVLQSLYLSSELEPFPVLDSPEPSLRVTVGGVTRTITLAARPTSLREAAEWLEAAIRAAGGDGLGTACMTVLGHQLLFVPGALGEVQFGKVSGVDEASVEELGLLAEVPVRVRVNGAESLDAVRVKLTT